MMMQVDLERINDAVLFRGTNEGGNEILIDGSEEIGGVNGGFRPMQLLLAGIGGCSALDAVHILKKQHQEIKDLRIKVTGNRLEGKTTSVFSDIHLHYSFTGDLDENKVARALHLAVEVYCSVGEMLKKTAKITYGFDINGATSV